MQGCMQYHVILGRIIRVLTVCHIWMNKYIPAVAHIIFYLNKLQFLHKIHIDDKKNHPCIDQRVLSEAMRPYLKLGPKRLSYD